MDITLSEKQQRHLQKLGVSLVYLFGSYSEGYAGPLSDLDIAVLYQDLSMLSSNNMGETYYSLYDFFTDLFPGKQVDIVFLQKANLELRFDVIQYGKILYQSSLEEKLSFEERTTLFYADFKPVLTEMNEAIIERA